LQIALWTWNLMAFISLCRPWGSDRSPLSALLGLAVVPPPGTTFLSVGGVQLIVGRIGLAGLCLNVLVAGRYGN
jgi:hypothetical protein